MAATGGAMIANRRIEGAFNAPASIKPTLDTSRRKAKSSLPLRHRQATAHVGNAVVVALIVGLLNIGGPSAVAGAISPVIVQSVQGVLVGWCGSHVLQERQEGFVPSAAHLDAATPIAGIPFRIWVMASLFGGSPRMKGSAVAHSMNEKQLAGLFSLEASTALGLAHGELNVHDVADLSAITATTPDGILCIGFAGGSAYDCESCESLPLQIANAMELGPSFWPTHQPNFTMEGL